MPTFFEQREKIIQAYFKDEIKPFDGEFCFCGTLNGNNGCWASGNYKDELPYSSREFERMEGAIYSGLIKIGLKVENRVIGATHCIRNWELLHTLPDYEEALFDGMCAALDVLKTIHQERGENVDEVPVFAKRVLIN